MLNNLMLYCLKYAESVLPGNEVFSCGSKEKKIPISFAIYLIKFKGRNILVDAGCDTMPGFDMKKFYSPAFVLREIGITADDVTDIIITHSHHDHIEAVKHFKNAEIFITEAEYEIGKRYIPHGIKVNIFNNEYNFNPQIKIVEWGGHSRGSAIVKITDNDITHILAGDECYSNDCIVNRIPTGVHCNLDKSREFVENFSGEKYIVHTYHDINLKTERII
ncbi:MAG: MBL fold metallo-hydrolase [Clostridia bacterium]|nr:MBL fold metallo-hydrolase [Clostridia bacterium]